MTSTAIRFLTGAALAFAALGTSPAVPPGRTPHQTPQRSIRAEARPPRTPEPGRLSRRSGGGAAAGRLLVKFKPSLRVQTAEGVLRAYGLTGYRRVPEIGVVVVEIPAAGSTAEALAALRRNPDVEFAEPDYRCRIAATPNDEYFRLQYALANTGDILDIPGSPRGQADADIHATAAWESAKGSPDVVIAILDSGVDLEHPDIMNKLVSAGRDFVNDDASADDDHWHGTHVAGIAAAETNNRTGIAGVAWDCRVLPVKVVDANGEGFYSTLIEGIVWAADNGADVINLSVGGDEAADSLRDALEYAFDKGVVIVASAGNDGTGVLYPAAYDDYVLAVAATDYNDARQDWSNFGASIDVAAPGVDILSLVPVGYWGEGSLPYGYATGTSQAAPHVAGFAALVRSAKPFLTPYEVMNVIRYTADDVNAAAAKGVDDEAGYGRINMERALVPARLK